MKNCSNGKEEEDGMERGMMIGQTYKKDVKAIREECGKKKKIQKRYREEGK
jgi:hypothetical protein